MVLVELNKYIDILIEITTWKSPVNRLNLIRWCKIFFLREIAFGSRILDVTYGNRKKYMIQLSLTTDDSLEDQKPIQLSCLKVKISSFSTDFNAQCQRLEFFFFSQFTFYVTEALQI